ncbi:MAG: penicillin-binding protein 2 [Pseudomonadales bacterium]
MNDSVTIRDNFSEQQLFASRLSLAIAIVVSCLSIIAYRYFSLQVLEHSKYTTESERNRVHVQAVAPKRGLITDRNGILLAENRPSYTLGLVKERVKNMDSLLASLVNLLDIPEDDQARFKEQLRFARPFEAVPLKFNLSEEQRAILAVNRHALLGIDVTAELARYYPEGELYAHVVGYTGRINKKEQDNIDLERYDGTHHIGKVGLEKQYEDILLGEVGYRNVEVNAFGRIIRILESNKPVPGQDLELFLDSRVHKVAHDVLGTSRGAIVAIEVQTGGIIAMASTPSFDSNQFVSGVSTKQYSQWRDSPDLPLYNRAIQGQYPPGSTLKPIFALAGLHYSVIDESHVVRDRGWYRLPNDSRQYRDWKRGGHGTWVGMHQAIEQSCDIFFYDLAFNLGIDRLHDFSEQFGLGTKTGLDIPSERSGLLPSSSWKRNVRGQPWFPGETLSAGIGQGYMLATPLQLAVATAALARRGERVTPRLVNNVSSLHPPPITNRLENTDLQWQQVLDAMEAVVHGARGTARSISRDLDYKIAGKTGTAQVVSIAQGEEYDAEALAERNRDHKLFVGFAPADAPLIAVAVVIENGGKTGKITGAPLVRKVMDAYLEPILATKEKTADAAEAARLVAEQRTVLESS